MRSPKSLHVGSRSDLHLREPARPVDESSLTTVSYSSHPGSAGLLVSGPNGAGHRNEELR